MARVLLVDDDLPRAAELRRELAAAGHEVALAPGVADAREHLAARLPGAVVVAEACDGGAGARLADELRAADATRGLPLVRLGAAPRGAGELADAVARAIRSRPPVDLRAVEAKLAQARRDDYFAVLGLARGATADEARAAAGRLLAELSPDRFDDPAASPALAAMLSEIRQVVADAGAVLGDEELRRAYLRGQGA